VQGEAIPLSDLASSASEASFRDIEGHWAEKGIKAWTARELACGYPDGTFRPDSPVTRAEFVTLLNRVFGYANLVAEKVNSPVTFRDVAATDWFAGEIATAAAVGYLSGYSDGTIKPQNQITRQEVAAVLARILPIAEVEKNNAENNIDGNFTDQVQIQEWSEAAITAVVNGGYMIGYPDGTFQPNRPITRAEAISVLDRAVGTLYNRAGTYGPFQGTVVLEGNVTINTPGITVQNTVITGNLYLTEGIGEGDVTLNNVTVQGTTKITGGGRDSIHLRNTAVGAVFVNVLGRKLVRLLAKGNTEVGTLEARTPVRLEEEGLTGSGFTKACIYSNPLVVDSSVPVELSGQFNEIEIQSLAEQPQFALTQIKISPQTTIENLIANAPTKVQGEGTIETAQVNVDGVVIEAPVKKVLLADGVQAMVNGNTITENYQYTETQKKKSKDVTLTDLTINGTTIAGFAVETLSYEVVLPYGTTVTEIPVVAATAHHTKATVEVTQATGLTAPDNVATVLVTAENGRTQTYTVTFTVAPSPETALSVFYIGGYNVLELPGVTEETGATLSVPSFSGLQGITVQTAGPDVQAVTVTVNDTAVTEEGLATQVIQPNDVIVVTIVAADGESTAQYKVTVEYGPIEDFTYTEDNGTSATFTWTTPDGAEAIEIQQSTDDGETWEKAYTPAINPAATSSTVVGLTAGETYKFKLVVTGGNNAGDSNEVEVTTNIDNEAAVYGASWDSSTGATDMTRKGDADGKTAGADFDEIAPWSGMKLCNVDDDGEITAYFGAAEFKRDGTNGQVMVKIPKFYYKHTRDDNGVHEFWVSDKPAAGFKLHPAFIRAGEVKDYVLLGAYKASFGRNQADTADALASVSGVLPAVSKTITEFRELAEARGMETGANWTQVDALTRNAVALLYLVEYANTNCQSAIGAGITDFSNTACVASGGCDYLNGASGNAVGDIGKVSVSYRGVEDLWGNVWEFVDGINIKNSEKQVYIADHGFVSDRFAQPYQPTGVFLPLGEGYIKDFACSAEADWLLMPTVVGEETSYIPDYFYQYWDENTEDKVAMVGGRWNLGNSAGLFYWNVAVPSSTAALHMGARLLFIP